MFEVKTNTDEEIKKLEQYVELLKLTKEIAKSDECMTTMEISQYFGCSIEEAREFMNRPDFPRLDCGKGMKCSRLAFHRYLLERRVKSDI